MAKFKVNDLVTWVNNGKRLTTESVRVINPDVRAQVIDKYIDLMANTENPAHREIYSKLLQKAKNINFIRIQASDGYEDDIVESVFALVKRA